MVEAVDIKWSPRALADLDRFTDFLDQHHLDLAPQISREIKERARVLCEHPLMGRQVGNRPEYRQIALRVLNAAYVFQYRYDGKSLVMLRVSHAREQQP